MKAADRGREIRRKLAAATAELIVELGWSAVSTRLVAARAGVAASLVHYHFPSIDVLRREAAMGVLTELLDAARQQVEQADTAEIGLSELLEVLDREDGAVSLLFVEAYLAATRDDVLRVQLSRLAADFRQTLARLLDDNGIELPEPSAVVLAAALDGLMLHRALDPTLSSQGVGTVLNRLLTC
ncbi:TetR/AcrR family transcriptional regulator [Kribbella sp. HUAS MG21]|uniref:TetR/AcrR family transcriptional regulator n=1 Tax=Kribbella sp. HUAS MG21 TaxID=3160966 RepID=A0AAU7T556_9ACTN